MAKPRPGNWVKTKGDVASLETEAYLLYNIHDDSVVLIEDGSTPRLLAADYDQQWPTFNDFLPDFFEL